MSPEVLSTGTILIGLVCLFLSIGVLQRQTASPVMPRRPFPSHLFLLLPVGLMSSPEWTSDSEPSPVRAPVPEFSPVRAPVPEFRPRRAPVPEFSSRSAPGG